MNNNLEKAKEILKKYDQEHLLCLYEELDEDKQSLLINQILKINFEEILSLYDNSMKKENINAQEISPLAHFEKDKLTEDELNSYAKIGEEQIRNNTFAVITMAGGQGTRLGYKGPKGTYMLDLKPVKKSLFQIMCEDIKRINEQYNVTIPWYIMTSEDNDNETKRFFEVNRYFDYPQDKVHFFMQGKLPIISVDRKLILQEPYIIKEASNGNGNVFNSMKASNVIEELEKDGIKWISFGGIDNVLLKNVDPLFLGITVKNGYSISSKSIFKKKPMEKTAVYCKKDGKPAILDYDDIDLNRSVSRDEKGFYLYREANMLSHLMSIEAVKKVSEIKLRYHRAYKKNAFVNFEGVKQVPDKPNTFKFENFIFDAFGYFDDMLLLRVNPDEEFAPIKDFTGIYNPDTAMEKYEKFFK